MKGNRIRSVMIYDNVEASDRHCSGSCQHMSHPQTGAHCDLFDIQLVWNKRKKYDGYIRCSACKRAEDLAEEQEI
jgi:hypothetical protein